MKFVASLLSTLISIEYDRLWLYKHYPPKRENRKAESVELMRLVRNRQKTQTIIEFGIELRHRLDDLNIKIGYLAKRITELACKK